MFNSGFALWWVALIVGILIFGVVKLDLRAFEKIEEQITQEKKKS
jgi:hypothetical protein